MALPPIALWYEWLGGQNGHHEDRLRQDQRMVELVTAKNVIPDPAFKLVTAPGFDAVRASAMSGSAAIQGMFYLGDLANEFILWNANDGKPYRDNANPPGVLAGGTAFATGANVLVRGDIFNNKLIVVSSSRNIPATISAAAAWADLTGTPARGIDVKAFARRVCMFSPSDGTTTYRSIMSFNSGNDDETLWTNPYTTNFLNFGRTGTDVNLLGGEFLGDHLMAFTEDAVYRVYATPNATLPMAFQGPFFKEKGGGPTNIHAVVPADGRLFWISKNYDVKQMDGAGHVSSIGFAAQPFLRGLSNSRRIYTVGGWEPRYRLVCWAVSNGSDTQNNDLICLHVDTRQYYFLTRSRNAFANRTVSGQLLLVGGGYSGLFYNELTSATTGDLDNAASAIDALVKTPRLHWGMPGVLKKIPYARLEFDPIGTETVTVSVFYDDNTSADATSTYTLSGTDVKGFNVPTQRPYARIQFQVEDATSGERYRLLRVGVPTPLALSTSGA